MKHICHLLIPAVAFSLTFHVDHAISQESVSSTSEAKQGAPAKALTVRQLQDIALNNSLTVTLSEKSKTIGRLQIDTQSRERLPDISWNSRLQRTYRQSSRSQSVNDPYETTQSHLLSLDYMLYDFGKQSAAVAGAQAQLSIYEHQHMEAKIDVIWGVAQAVHSVLTADNLIQNLERQQEVLRKRLDLQKSYYRKGLRSEADIVAAEIDFNRNLLALEQTHTEKRTIISQLMNLMNLSKKEQEALAVKLEALPSYDLSMDKIKNVGLYVRNLNDKTFALIDQTYKHEREKIEAALNSKKADYWPNIGMFADAGKSGGTRDPSKELTNQGSFGVQLSWTLPWKGKDQAEVQTLYTQLSINETQHKLALQKAEEETREKKLLLLQLYRQIKLLDQQLDLSRRQQELLRNRYTSGNATTFELSQLENELLKLELDRSQKAGQFIQHSLDIAQLFDERNLQKEVFEDFY